MKFKQLLAKEVDLSTEILPASYHVLGQILLLKLNKKAEKYKKEIGNAILKIYPYVKAVFLQKGIFGVYRKPKIEHIAGLNITETLHKELNCSFKLDVKKIMWAKGNHAERKRMLSLVKKNE
ncbi:MAG: class I SAM-dependent methyltransferase family protein, partial [Candidatus Nanoarchaeia archaeon]